jgi:hypothetical protein
MRDDDDSFTAFDTRTGRTVRLRAPTREEMAKARTPADWLKMFPNPTKSTRKQLDDQEISPLTGAAYPRGRLFLDVLDEMEDEEDKDRERDADDTEKRADHHASVVADLLVEAGSHSSRASALAYLLHNSHGAALLHRTRKAEKEQPTMSSIESLENIVKAHGVAGVVQIAKNIADEQKSFRITEKKMVDLIETAARISHPELGALAFEKVYEHNPVLARAISVIKAAGAAFDVTIVNPGDATYQTVNATEQSEAYQQLEALASKLHATATGKLTKEQAFARAFEANPALAAKAHRRPTPPPGGAYPHPR